MFPCGLFSSYSVLGWFQTSTATIFSVVKKNIWTLLENLLHQKKKYKWLYETQPIQLEDLRSSIVPVYSSPFCDLKNMALSCHSETKAPRDEHSSVTIQSHNSILGETNAERERPKDLVGFDCDVTFFCNDTISMHNEEKIKWRQHT